jgi:hypothetical protein
MTNKQPRTRHIQTPDAGPNPSILGLYNVEHMKGTLLVGAACHLVSLV